VTGPSDAVLSGLPPELAAEVGLAGGATGLVLAVRFDRGELPVVELSRPPFAVLTAGSSIRHRIAALRRVACGEFVLSSAPLARAGDRRRATDPGRWREVRAEIRRASADLSLPSAEVPPTTLPFWLWLPGDPPPSEERS